MGFESLNQYVGYAGVVAVGLWIFWALYVFSMGVYRAERSGRLVGLNRFMAIPILIVAYLVDIVFNVTLFSVVFLEPPEEWLLTTRLKRYMVEETGFRKKIALYLCDSILDPFDPSDDHC